MDRVQFTQVISSAVAEGAMGRMSKMALLLQFHEQLLQTRTNQLRECEKELTRPCDVDCTNLSRPFKQILEDVAMDRLQMLLIE